MRIALINLAFKTIVACAATSMFPSLSWAQCPTPPHISYPPYNPDTAEILMTKPDGQGQVVCQVTNQGYIKEYVTKEIPYKMHFTATSSGGCQTRYTEWGVWPPQCVNSFYQFRYLGMTTITHSESGLSFGNISPFFYGTIQAIDTRPTPPLGTNSTGFDFSPTSLGTYTYTSYTSIDATSCGLTPTSVAAQPFRVNVLKCEPIFLNNSGQVPHLDTSNPIQIYLPSNMVSVLGTPLQDAVDDWNSKQLGPTLQVVTSQCSYGPNCVSVIEDSSLGMCGEASYVSMNSMTGVTSGMVLKVDSNWADWTPSGARRTFAHELGHYHGMNNANAANCQVNDAVMQDTFNCGGQNEMDDVTLMIAFPLVTPYTAVRPKQSADGKGVSQ